MFCQKCGKSLEDSAKFCVSCGQAISSTANVNTIEKAPEVLNVCADDNKQNLNTTTGEFAFNKNKMIGYLTYKSLHTKAILSTDSIEIIKQTKVLGFIPLREKKHAFQKNQIKQVNIGKKMDVIDGIYGIVLTFIGLISFFTAGAIGFLFLVFAAVCFWTGYGKVITIETTSGKPITIATSSGEQEELLVQALKVN